MTEKTALLRRTIAEFFDVDEDRVGPAFPLFGQRGQSSIARAALDSAIRRRVGLKSRKVYSAKTYGELEVELLGHATETEAISAIPAGSAALAQEAVPEPLHCGIDIELIENLPVVADHWEDAFYRDHFTPSEIAYCLMQAEPAQHFAARWCAKEALKKCDKDLMVEELKNLDVNLDDSGAPYFMHRSGEAYRRLPHAVSLSHTSHMAIAMVVRSDEPRAELISVPEVRPAQFITQPAPPPVRSRLLGPLLILLNLATLASAAWHCLEPSSDSRPRSFRCHFASFRSAGILRVTLA